MAETRKSQGSAHVTQAAELMRLGLSGAEPCTTEELGAYLEYHLAAPMYFDAGGLGSELASRLKTAAEENGLLLKSLRDLFEHPKPPLELLQMVKDFAKSCTEYADATLPRDVGRVLYYTAIAAGWLRWKTRLSSLTDADLLKGVHWALEQPWLDGTSRKLLTEVIQTVEKGAPV